MIIWALGRKAYIGEYGLEKDMTRAIELYERAAELGVSVAHYNLGVLYARGTDVEKDTAKAIRHYETAAICGHVNARHNLGIIEGKAGNHVIALEHMMIAVKLGHEYSLNMVKSAFMAGLATKVNYAEALRGYQSAIEEMSSPDRAEAKALGRRNNNNSRSRRYGASNEEGGALKKSRPPGHLSTRKGRPGEGKDTERQKPREEGDDKATAAAPAGGVPWPRAFALEEPCLRRRR
ncbi:hypothetical protein THAOC_10934, partial [Thalassiosira oceanica]